MLKAEVKERPTGGSRPRTTGTQNTFSSFRIPLTFVVLFTKEGIHHFTCFGKVIGQHGRELALWSSDFLILLGGVGVTRCAIAQCKL